MSRFLPPQRLHSALRPRRQHLLSCARPYASFSRPSPPKLPQQDQTEFERLQREASVSGAFTTPLQTDAPATTTGTNSAAQGQDSLSSSAAGKQQAKSEEEDDDTVNRGIFRGAPPEFRGDTNPKTGEVGGPKNEPLRWGGGGDWSYNGRVTDF